MNMWERFYFLLFPGNLCELKYAMADLILVLWSHLQIRQEEHFENSKKLFSFRVLFQDQLFLGTANISNIILLTIVIAYSWYRGQLQLIRLGCVDMHSKVLFC